MSDKRTLVRLMKDFRPDPAWTDDNNRRAEVAEEMAIRLLAIEADHRFDRKVQAYESGLVDVCECGRQYPCRTRVLLDGGE